MAGHHGVTSRVFIAPADPGGGPRWRFGRFELQPAARRLLEEGRPVPLGARAFDLLEALVSRHERVLGKAELMELVWPGRAVEEANLTVQVSTLRQVIGPAAITTIPGRGYRFTAPLEAVEGGALPALRGASAQPGSFTNGTLKDGPLTNAPARHAEAHPGNAAASPWLAHPGSWSDGSGSWPDGPGTLPGIGWLHGRTADRTQLVGLMRRHRLVTVVGPGGVGKSALAAQVAAQLAEELREGACRVGVHGLAPQASLPATIGQALGAPAAAGASAAALGESLHAVHLLLLIDDAEACIAAVAGLADTLLRRAPGLRLLVTSQCPTGLEGEVLWRLEPLPLPPPGLTLPRALDCACVALFIEQAQALDRHFTPTAAQLGRITTLCRQLDGLPLALRLAAARQPLLGLQGLLARRADWPTLLASDRPGLPPRHRSLQGLLDWSFGLLAVPELRLLQRLSVRGGGFTLEQAVAVAADTPGERAAVIDSLSRLIDRSLVIVDGGDAPRCRLLETTRQHALRQLQRSGELAAVQRRLAAAR